jgi:hypothetical protein
MKSAKNKANKKREVSNLVKDIDNIIDTMAYSKEGENSMKNKNFLDNLYLLKEEE